MRCAKQIVVVAAKETVFPIIRRKEHAHFPTSKVPLRNPDEHVIYNIS